MIKRTHLAVGLAVGLYFLPFVTHKLFFIPIVLLGSILPDIDSATSFLGRRRIFRPVQLFFRHRGPIHSYTVCGIICLIFAFFYPVVALPLFFGYSLHLFLDSFTVGGIKPLWPLNFQSSGIVRTGGAIDKVMFSIFIVVDFFLFILLFV